MLKKRKVSNAVQVIILSFLVPGMALISGASHARGGLASASGHGNLVMEGALRTFSFQAREFHDGHVQGSLVLKNRHLGVRVRADIDCLHIDGDEAILSGTLTQIDGIEEGGVLIGDVIWFYVRDKGEGRGDPADQISALIVEDVDDSSKIFDCETLLEDIPAMISEGPDMDNALDLQNIIGGNVQIR